MSADYEFSFTLSPHAPRIDNQMCILCGKHSIWLSQHGARVVRLWFHRKDPDDRRAPYWGECVCRECALLSDQDTFRKRLYPWAPEDLVIVLIPLPDGERAEVEEET